MTKPTGRPPKTTAIDITGQRYGRLVAIKRVGGRRTVGRHHDSVWLFRCDCGQEKEIALSPVRSGITKSCGCLRVELAHLDENISKLRRVQPGAVAVLTLDVTGERYGRLVAVKRVGTSERGNTVWLFCCDCGVEKAIPLDHVRQGLTQSCGCLHREFVNTEANKAQLQRVHADAMRQVITHDMSKTVTYNAWIRMKQFCFNPAALKYKYYGGRGITVCERWRDSFENFYADIGPRPSDDYWLVRIDKDGDYEPDNVRWEERPRRVRGRFASPRTVEKAGLLSVRRRRRVAW